ncbi:hypothetical protein [Mucilaginibacter sp. CSA2-8R]|uniref:hypothetical protein n=1 Tax=Mucilaginibacter sp. CSA2-8R TaxID=3141542 RepID=UPI00315CDECF
MISEQEYINYFTALAIRHKDIRHIPKEKDAFFFVPMPWDLSAIDEAIRNTGSTPMVALDAMRGKFDENRSDSYLQEIEGQFTILEKVDLADLATISQAQDKCLAIGRQMLAKMKNDARHKKLIKPLVSFSIAALPYEPVGPMEVCHYGYTFQFTLKVPIDMVVSHDTWLDVDNEFFPYDLNPTT